jgi:hypothetical protein
MFYFETSTSIGMVKLSKRSVFYEGEYKMSEAIKLTPEDIQIIKTDIDEATKWEARGRFQRFLVPASFTV